MHGRRKARVGAWRKFHPRLQGHAEENGPHMSEGPWLEQGLGAGSTYSVVVVSSSVTWLECSRPSRFCKPQNEQANQHPAGRAGGHPCRGSHSWGWTAGDHRGGPLVAGTCPHYPHAKPSAFHTALNAAVGVSGEPPQLPKDALQLGRQAA